MNGEEESNGGDTGESGRKRERVEKRSVLREDVECGVFGNGNEMGCLE